LKNIRGLVGIWGRFGSQREQPVAMPGCVRKNEKEEKEGRLGKWDQRGKRGQYHIGPHRPQGLKFSVVMGFTKSHMI
jgi:hypothetical protein